MTGNPGQVVLGYDGSPASNRAAAFAFRHAEAVGCGVVAVSVEATRGEPESYEFNPRDATPGSDTGAFHSPVIVIAAAFPDVPVSFVAGTGRPAEVLLAEAAGAELLVVGSRGSGGFAGLIMGSVSQKVLGARRLPGCCSAPRDPRRDGSRDRLSRRSPQSSRIDVTFTSVAGFPSSPPPATPASAILSRVARPVASMVPNTV